MSEESKKPGMLQRLKAAWSQLTFLVTAVGVLVGGVVWVDDKIDEIEQRGVDVTELKQSNARLRAEQAATNTRISEGVTAITLRVTAEFRARDVVDRELDARISAVLRELRTRHGVLVLADEGHRRSRVTQIREAQAASDGASVAMPDPLEGLGGL